MGRPRKAQKDKRRHVINVRLNDGELAELKKLAADAGMPYRRYARETVLGRKPKARPVRTLVFQKLLYELQHIATNFQQLAEVTGADTFTDWARYVGGQLVEHLIGRDDLADLVERQLDEINGAGQLVNTLARKANSGKDIDRDDRQEAFHAVKLALKPIVEALGKPAGNRPAKPLPKAPAER